MKQLASCIFHGDPDSQDLFRRLEYMALEKVAITIDTPRMRELFRADDNILLYPTEDANALTKILFNVLEDRELCQRVAKSVSALVRARYTWAHHASELEAAFSEALREMSNSESRK